MNTLERTNLLILAPGGGRVASFIGREVIKWEKENRKVWAGCGTVITIIE